MLNKKVLKSTPSIPNAPTPITVDVNLLNFVDYSPVIYVDY